MDHKTLPRDVFLYLLQIITLAAISVAFGVLIYQYINIKFPDVLTEGYYLSRSSIYSAIRTSMATLIVVFPVFAWVSWFLKKDINKNPEKKDLKIRRWLLYLTLFIAALIIIGDLIALLMNFLNGELTLRFMLKVVTVLFIAGSIFVHYFSELREKSFSWMANFDKFVIVLVIAAIISGFWIAGSPQEQRAIRMDERRINDLSTIQYQIINYWQSKQRLPVNLSELQDDISGFIVPKDPETGTDYGYRVTTPPYSFELCADFTAANDDLYGRKDPSVAMHIGGGESNWGHGEGRTCFERTIDPDLYPPIKR
jgi:hypothetical protein